MKHKQYTIGLDFGSDSARALIVDVSNGDELATGVCNYPRWMQGKYSDASISKFRHHPQDYIDAMTAAITNALKSIDPVITENIVGIGVDTTGSTPAPVDEEGTVLALKPEFAENPNAMFILWKDHTAIQKADLINRLAHSETFPDYTQYIGGEYSSEWYWAKAAYVSEQDEMVAKNAYTWVELADWIPALLCNTVSPKSIKRGICASGHKALWHKSWGGLPSEEFLTAISPTLAGQREHYSQEVYTSDKEAGKLSKEWSDILGLPEGISVAVGAFDCHMGAVGAGARTNDLVKVMGTSTCDILMTDSKELGNKTIKGICGQVEGSALPDFTALEAGQSAFGDIYAWYQRLLGWPLQLLAKKNPELKDQLDTLSSQLIPLLTDAISYSNSEKNDDVIAIDWFNGRRTPCTNQHLKGTISNLNLGTSAPEVFFSLIESTAFGAKAINNSFIDQGVNINRVLAIGGISKKSPQIMQICSDIMGFDIAIVESDQCCALGAAIFGALAAGCYPDSEQAQKAMGSSITQIYHPREDKNKHYEERYKKYQELGQTLEELTMRSINNASYDFNAGLTQENFATEAINTAS